jgi:hypothetical protein
MNVMFVSGSASARRRPWPLRLSPDPRRRLLSHWASATNPLPPSPDRDGMGRRPAQWEAGAQLHPAESKREPPGSQQARVLVNAWEEKCGVLGDGRVGLPHGLVIDQSTEPVEER